MRVYEAYNEWSATYDTDKNATRDLDKTVLARSLGSFRFGTIVEAGCGTGKNTEVLLKIGREVQALDFSEGMLAKARARFKRPARVQFVRADLLERWPLPPGTADLVTFNLVLEHVEKLRPVFAEAARVLVSGGRMFVSELHPFRQYEAKRANFRRGNKTITVAAHVHHVSDFVKSAQAAGFALTNLEEWWHARDKGKTPRLVSLLFEKIHCSNLALKVPGGAEGPRPPGNKAEPGA